ncbi:MAG: DUF4065 domain-containing protein [Flavobacteriaceae bacterium]|nr:DUF4065 domain-containing protein [Flavobacteriaceae bacterium]
MKKFPPYTAAHIGNYIIEQGEKDYVEVTPLKLQKLLYFLFGEFYASTRQKLFKDSFYAWKHGPIIPHIYEQLKHYGKKPIFSNFHISHCNFKTEKTMWAPTSIINENTISHLKPEWNYYKNIDARELVKLTHERNTPWYHIYDYRFERKIPSRKIKNYFCSI